LRFKAFYSADESKRLAFLLGMELITS